jgi:hypothetical protein
MHTTKTINFPQTILYMDKDGGEKERRKMMTKREKMKKSTKPHPPNLSSIILFSNLLIC